MHNPLKDSIADFKRASTLWQAKEVRLLVRRGSIFGACSFQIRNQSQPPSREINPGLPKAI